VKEGSQAVKQIQRKDGKNAKKKEKNKIGIEGYWQPEIRHLLHRYFQG